MKIAVGNSRMDKKWKNRDISWEDFCARVSTTQRTTETVEEWNPMEKVTFPLFGSRRRFFKARKGWRYTADTLCTELPGTAAGSITSVTGYRGGSFPPKALFCLI